MLLLALLACQSQEADGAPVRPEVVVDVSTQPVPKVPAVDEWTRFADVVVTGSDLDHDGVLEWATLSIPWDDYSYTVDDVPSVQVFEGTELLTTLEAPDDRSVWQPWAMSEAAGVDIDTDGHPDLVLTSRDGGVPAQLILQTGLLDQVLLSTDPGDGRSKHAQVTMAHTDVGPELVALTVADEDTLRIDRLTDAPPDEPWLRLPQPEPGYWTSVPPPRRPRRSARPPPR